MRLRSLLSLTSLLFSLHSAAQTVTFEDSERYKGHGYVEFERLNISDDEAIKAGSGFWIKLKLDFTGLTINGRQYGANGQAQISIDSHYSTASPRWEMGLKGGYCDTSESFEFPHYSVTSLKRIVEKHNIHVGGPSVKNFGCDLRVYVGRHQPMTAEMLLSSLEGMELDFVLYVLTNTETFISDAVRTSQSMTAQAKTSWKAVQKDFWRNWIGSVNKAAEFTVPFFQRTDAYDEDSFESDNPPSTMCLLWELSTPPRNDVLKTILANAQLFTGEINASRGGAEFCSAIRDLEKQQGNGDGTVSATEASRILSLPSNRIGTLGWASPIKPDIKAIKSELKNKKLYFGTVDSKVTELLVSALEEYDRSHGNGDGHLNIREIAALNNETESQPNSGLRGEFCGIKLDYIPSAFDQGLDDPIRIQRGLIASNLLTGEADGIPGPKTCAAFQRYVDLNGSGGTLNRDRLIKLIALGHTLSKPLPKTEPFEGSKSFDSLSSQVEQLKMQIDSKNEEIKLIANNVSARDRDIRDLKLKIRELESEIQNKEKQLKVAKTAVDVYPPREALLKQINALISEQDELIATRERLTKALSEGPSQEALKTEIKTLERQLKAAQDRLTSSESDLVIVQREADLQSRLTKVSDDALIKERARNMELSRTIAALESEKAALMRKATKPPDGQAVNSLKQENRALTRSLSDKETEVGRLSATNKQLQTDKQLLVAKITELQSALAKYQSGETARISWLDQLSDEWRSRLNDMPIQQRQFCNIASDFNNDLIEAEKSGNQIRINMTFRDRQRSLDSLLPKGKFNDWLVRVVSVGQQPDGSARFIAELPCQSLIGSGEMGEGDQLKWFATIPYEDRAYRELAKVSRGDFIAVQGALVEVQNFVRGQPESYYGIKKIGRSSLPEIQSMVEAGKIPANRELFIAKIDYLVMLTN